jgi:hypothetical protein
MFNVDTGRMPPFFVEHKRAEVPAGGDVFVYGSTVPEDENWLLVGVSVYVPHNSPCYAVLQLQAVAGSSEGQLDLAMTKNYPHGHDTDLQDSYVTKRLIVPGGGRLRAFVRNGSGQSAGDGHLVAHYLRYPANVMPRGM